VKEEYEPKEEEEGEVKHEEDEVKLSLYRDLKNGSKILMMRITRINGIIWNTTL